MKSDDCIAQRLRYQTLYKLYKLNAYSELKIIKVNIELIN